MEDLGESWLDFEITLFLCIVTFDSWALGECIMKEIAETIREIESLYIYLVYLHLVMKLCQKY